MKGTNYQNATASAYVACAYACVVRKWGESGWFSGHQPCLPPVRSRFNSGLGSNVGWVSVDLNLTPMVFLRVLRFSSLLKIDSRPIPSGCGAVLRGHTWVVVRGRVPSRQHSSFGPTSLSCVLSNSVSDCEKGRLAGKILCVNKPLEVLYLITRALEYFSFFITKLVKSWFSY